MRSASSLARTAALTLALLFVASACSMLPPVLFGVTPTATPEPTICSSAEDLRGSIARLRETDLSEVGVLGLLVTVDVAIEAARTLAASVGEVYRPLTQDVITSLQGLRTTLDELGDQPTLGASMTSIGEAIVEIGQAADALEVQLRTPCPTEVPQG